MGVESFSWHLWCRDLLDLQCSDAIPQGYRRRICRLKAQHDSNLRLCFCEFITLFQNAGESKMRGCIRGVEQNGFAKIGFRLLVRALLQELLATLHVVSRMFCAWQTGGMHLARILDLHQYLPIRGLIVITLDALDRSAAGNRQASARVHGIE